MKRILITALILTSVVILSGCQTTLKAYEPGSTALVLVLDNEKEAGTSPFGSYYAVFTDLATGKEAAPVKLDNGDDVYTLEVNMPPGEYYLSQTYFQFNEDRKIPDSERKFYEEDFAPITITEGTIALCPAVFSTSITKKGDLRMTVLMNLSVYKDKSSVRGKDALKLLKTKYPEVFATWSVQE